MYSLFNHRTKNVQKNDVVMFLCSILIMFDYVLLAVLFYKAKVYIKRYNSVLGPLTFQSLLYFKVTFIFSQTRFKVLLYITAINSLKLRNVVLKGS